MNNDSPDRRHALRRRAQILELVRRQAVRSQGELGQLLRRRGFSVAQPTLSRDVKELGLARTPAGYAVPAAPAEFVPSTARQATVDRVLAQHVLSVRAAASLVVVKTPPASAHPVARALDEAGLPGIVGTIAGDDTVFIATADAEAALALERRLLAPLTPSRRKQGARG